MRSAFFIFLLTALVFAYASSEELSPAQPCNITSCQLPNCRCSGLDIPGGLRARDTPQFVLLTFDDAVSELNTATYRTLLYGRRNKNQCPIGTTFFVSHEYTDYIMVNELYNQGFEMALHSISHRTPQEFWRYATHEQLMRDIGDQRQQLSFFANIPIDTVNGLRSPFLQMSGDNTFTMMRSAGINYDSSWPTTRFTNPGMWPYTLNYQSTQDCVVNPCPTSSIPGPWVMPMIAWTDLQGFPCSMADACIFTPEDEEGWFQFILRNFERHYLSSRSPFGIYIHEGYIRSRPHVLAAVERFLDLINNIDDVFMVNAKEVIEWVQNPTPVNEYSRKECRRTIPASCRPTFCPSLFSQDTFKTYYLRVCTTCPRNYPWVNNPLGV